MRDGLMWLRTLVAVFAICVPAAAQEGAKQVALPEAYKPYISPDAYQALVTFKHGSKVNAAENRRLHNAYDKAEEENRYNDKLEANLIRTLQPEAVAALWKLVADPAGNRYYLPKFTPVEERDNAVNRLPWDKSVIYKKSGDDLTGLRIAMHRFAPEGSGGVKIGGIFPVQWLKGTGITPIRPPDNLRVLISFDEKDPYGMYGMSFSVHVDGKGGLQLQPEIYTNPYGKNRFTTSTRGVVNPRGCLDCHADNRRFQVADSIFASPGGGAAFVKAIEQMPGVDGFLKDAARKGATPQDLQQAKAAITRPDTRVFGREAFKFAVLKLWDDIYYDRQPYLDDSDARYVEVHEKHGNAYRRVGEFKRAIEQFDKAIRRNPEKASLYKSRGLAYLETGQHRPAIADFDELLRLDKGNAWAHFARGASYGKVGESKRAIADYDEAIRLNPKYTDAYINRANAYRNQGDTRRAIADYDEAIRLEAKDPVPYIGRGIAYRNQGDSQRAISDYDEALRLDPNNALAYYSRGNAHNDKGEHRQALADFENAIRLNSKYAMAYNNAGWLLATCTKPEVRDGKKALLYATRACELTKWQEPNCLDTLAGAYAEAGQFTEAVRWQTKMTQLLEARPNPDERLLRERERAKARLQLYQSGKAYRME